MTSRAKLLGALAIGMGIFLGGCGGGGSSYTKPPISVTLSPSATQSIDQGQTVQFTATAANDSAGVTWTSTGQGMLSNQSTSSATFTASAVGSASVTATSVTDTTKSQTVNITVSATPSITTTTLPGATVGAAYNASIAATGGTGALTYSLPSGSSLPAGLALSSAGAITGTPTGVPGTANFTVQVADSSTAGPVTSTQALSLAVAVAPAITTTSLPAAVLGTAYSQTITVTGGTSPLTFSIPSGSLPTGLGLNSSTGAITGTPSGATGTTNFTVKVVDHNMVLATQALSITVNPSAVLTITTSLLLNPLVGENYSQTLQYTGSAVTLPVTWSKISGSLPAGLGLNSSGALTGIPTTAGTSNFTVQVSDSTLPTPATATRALTLTVTSASSCESGSEALLNGQYGISMTGFDANGPAGMLASFTADGTGKITSGVEDINSTGAGGVQTNLPVTTAGSSYSIGSDNRGCLTLVAGGVTRTFRITVGTLQSGIAQSGRIIEFDATGMNSVGTITIQVPATFSNAMVAGTFNFALNSALPASAGSGYAGTAGVLTLTNGPPTVTGVGDINVNGAVDSGNAQYPASPITFTPGAYNIAANGRGTLTYAVPGGSTIHLVVYVLNASQLLLISSDPQTAATPLSVGFAGLQSGGPYTIASLGATSVLFLSGQTAPGSSSSVEAGLFVPDGNGNFTFSEDLNSGGTISTQTINGTYTVAADGRVLVTAAGGVSPSIVIYLAGPNEGLAMSLDAHVMVGDFEPQNGAPFTDQSLSGATPYAIATINPVVPANGLIEGAETYHGDGTVDATFEFNSSGSLSLGNDFTGTYTVSSNGRAVRTWNGSTQKVSYIVTPTRVITFGNSPTDTNPTIFVSQQ